MLKRRSRSKAAARREFGSSLLLAVCVAAAVQAWNTTRSGTWTVLAAASPLVLVLLFILLRWDARRKALLSSGIEVIDRMTGEEFEELLLAHFQAQGYTGTLTPETTGDYGADLILERNGQRTVIQAKRYKNVVGIAAVQQVIGAIKYYQAESGMVITNSTYTPNAERLAQANGIELIDREQLIAIMRTSRGKSARRETQTERAEPKTERASILPDKICPFCGRMLVARTGKYGSFVGCSGYPTCRFTQQG